MRAREDIRLVLLSVTQAKCRDQTVSLFKDISLIFRYSFCRSSALDKDPKSDKTAGLDITEVLSKAEEESLEVLDSTRIIGSSCENQSSKRRLARFLAAQIKQSGSLELPLLR